MICKRGRPKKEVSKGCRFELRLERDEIKILEYLSFVTEKSKSEILRDALKLYHKIHMYSD